MVDETPVMLLSMSIVIVAQLVWTFAGNANYGNNNAIRTPTHTSKTTGQQTKQENTDTEIDTWMVSKQIIDDTNKKDKLIKIKTTSIQQQLKKQL